MIGLIDTLQSGNNRPNEVAGKQRKGLRVESPRRLGLQNNFAASGRLSCSVSVHDGRVAVGTDGESDSRRDGTILPVGVGVSNELAAGAQSRDRLPLRDGIHEVIGDARKKGLPQSVTMAGDSSRPRAELCLQPTTQPESTE